MKTFQERMADATRINPPATKTPPANPPSKVRPSTEHVLKITGNVSEWVLPASVAVKKPVSPVPVVKAPVAPPKRSVPASPALDRARH
jgi:hypothetical protein